MMSDRRSSRPGINMLVKFGMTWIDPAKIEFIQPKAGSVDVVTPTRSYLIEGDVDEFAKLINETLAPKQTWSSEELLPEEVK